MTLLTGAPATKCLPLFGRIFFSSNLPARENSKKWILTFLPVIRRRVPENDSAMGCGEGGRPSAPIGLPSLCTCLSRFVPAEKVAKEES